MTIVDFRANQVQTNKVIASGSTGTGAQILIYPISSEDSGSPNTGTINPNAFNTGSIGEDVFLYISGAKDSIGSNTHGASVFGGDLVISGNLKIMGSGGGSGEISASYLVLSATSSLANERVFTVGTSLSMSDGGPGNNLTLSYVGEKPELSASYLVLGFTSSLANERQFEPQTGLSASDGGSNGKYKLYIDDSIVATLSGSRFTGRVYASGGLTGSLREVSPGVPYMVAGPGITIVTTSVGSLEITGSSLAADVSASYIVVGTTSSLPNERALSVGTGLSSSDGGANNNFHVTAPFVSASYITINSESTLPNERALVFNGVLSSSDGGANGNFTVSYVGERPELSASYLTLGTTSSLANERVFTPGTGLSASDGGANGNYILNIKDSVVATISGAMFTGPVYASGGLTGSLQQVSPGIPYILGNANITVVTNSNGSIELSGSTPIIYGDVSASYIVIGTTSSLANERALIATTGISSSDGGANGNFVLSAPFVSASYITINSETTLPNERALVVTTGLSSSDGGANGNMVLSAPFVSASYITINSETTLPNERAFVVGTGLSSSDGGANGNFTVSIKDSVVATISGALFTGRVFASGGLTGSLQLVGTGIPYLQAGPNITIVTNSNGSISITGSTQTPVAWSTGSGSPEGIVTASIGALYTNTVGGAGVTLYVKESGSLANGWVPVPITPFGTSGSRPASAVMGTTYLDVTLGIPVWRSGSVWINAAGVQV